MSDETEEKKRKAAFTRAAEVVLGAQAGPEFRAAKGKIEDGYHELQTLLGPRLAWDFLAHVWLPSVKPPRIRGKSKNLSPEPEAKKTRHKRWKKRTAALEAKVGQELLELVRSSDLNTVEDAEEVLKKAAVVFFKNGGSIEDWTEGLPDFSRILYAEHRKRGH